LAARRQRKIDEFHHPKRKEKETKEKPENKIFVPPQYRCVWFLL